MSRFEPGEIAILANQNGGRRFTVEADMGTHVIERHPLASQQQYVQPTRHNQLTKVDPNQIEVVMAHLARVGDDYRFRVQALENERRNALAAILTDAAV